MRSRKEMYFRNLLTLSLALLFPALLSAQSEGVAPSAESSPSRSVKQRLESLPYFRPTPTATTDTQTSSKPSDRRSRASGHEASGLQPVRSLGAPVAAERYVFGRMDLATGDYPTAVAVGAFQTGGPQSIAVANNSYPGTVSILLANPDGTFQPRVDYPVGVEPSSIFVVDLNGDHNLDLVVSNWTGTVSILLGNGDGTFQPQIVYPVNGGFVGQVVVGDFNHDNKLDLAVAIAQ